MALAAGLFLQSHDAIAQSFDDTELSMSARRTYEPAFFADSRPATAWDMVQRVPGFQLVEPDDRRGLSGARANVLIDGRAPTSKSDTLKARLSRIVAGDVKRIEVFYAGASELDLATQTLIADVRLDHAPSRSFAATFDGDVREGGGGAHFGIEGSRRDGDFTHTASARIYTERSRAVSGLFLRIEPFATPIEGRLIETMDGQGQKLDADLLWSDPDGRSLTLGVNATADRGRSASAVRLDGAATDRERYASRYDTQGVEVTAAFVNRVSEARAFELEILQSLSDTGYDDAYRLGADSYSTDYDDRVTETTAKATVSQRVSDGLTLQAGAEGGFARLDGRSSYIDGLASIDLPAQDVSVSEWRSELFVRAKGRGGLRWRYDAGLALETATLRQRSDVRFAKTLQSLKPDLAVTYVINEHSQLSLSGARRVGQLDFSDFVTSVSLRSQLIEVGNPSLEPERRWTLDLGYNRVFWRDGALNLNLGYEWIDNPRDFVPLNGRDAPGALGGASRTYATASMTIPLDRLGVPSSTISGTLNLRRSRVTDPVTGERRELSGEVGASGSLAFRQDIPSRRINWSIDVQASSNSRSFRLREVRDYQARPSVGAQIEYQASKALKLSLRIETNTLAADNLRILYFNSRASGQIENFEQRSTQVFPILYFRVRKVFS
ncbi:MAG: outer membrane beta-barrel protein [Phenylobacterium sp.]|uniref:TonB-dependent receptor plug domain-containing protein n=1 Tax=Phenylobacterium sp. TaxID=1871053 RepID=UPI0027354F10|nr:TonB-dependent receptor [Phenylobacterium sp.]MDP3175629.1 outer membrane beta-barrel protein [Phenylobacterium sp.]